MTNGESKTTNHAAPTLAGQTLPWVEMLRERPIRQTVEGNSEVSAHGVALDPDGRPAFFHDDPSGQRHFSDRKFVGEIPLGPYRISKIVYRTLGIRARVTQRPVGAQPDLPAEVERCSLLCQRPDDPRSICVRQVLAEVGAESGLAHRYACLANLAPLEVRLSTFITPCNPAGVTPRYPHVPQYLTPQQTRDFLKLAGTAERLMLFMNGHHAGASANHLHWQCIYCADDERYAIESATAVDGIIGSDYPVAALVYDLARQGEQIVHDVARLQFAAIPFNLVCLRQRVFLIPRRPEAEVVAEFPDGVGALELCGRFVVSTADHSRLTLDVIPAGLRSLSLSPTELRQILR